MIKKVLKALTGEYMLTGKKYYQKGKEFLQCYEDARFVQSFIDSPRLNKMVGDYDDGWDKDSDAAIHHRMDTAPFVRVFESFVTAVKPSHGENFWAKESIEVNADGAERGQKHIEHDARGAIGAALRHFLDEYWWGGGCCCCCCCWSGILTYILLLHSLIQCHDVTLIQAMYIYSCHGNYLLS